MLGILILISPIQILVFHISPLLDRSVVRKYENRSNQASHTIQKFENGN
jgi:hypothetical protein